MRIVNILIRYASIQSTDRSATCSGVVISKPSQGQKSATAILVLIYGVYYWVWCSPIKPA